MRVPLLAGLFAAAVAALVPLCATAQERDPTLRLVVPYPAGGVTDLAARALAERLGPTLGQTVIVENRPGGGSRIGTDAVLKAAPDGRTLLFTNTSYTILPIVDPTLKIEPDRSLQPVGLVASYGLALAVASSAPVTTLPQLVAYARSHPGKLSYGSSGPGSGAHFIGEYFKSLTGTFIVHIPYRSTAAALNDVAAGVLDMTFDATAKAYADAGKVRILGVTGSHRDPRLPGVPTMAEAGLKDFVLESWVGLLAPAGTPPATVTRLNAALNEALAAPALRQRLQEMGLTPEGGAPTRMLGQIREETQLYRRIATTGKLRFD
jgi:tripartite-type tricarboxylate transporter receptor subunit TctC